MPATLDFSIHFQRAVLARTLQDQAFASKSKRILQVDNFDTDPFRWVYRKVTTEEASTFAILVDKLKREATAGKLKRDLAESIRQEIKLMIEGNSFDDAKYGLDTVAEFVSFKRLEQGLYDAATGLEKQGLPTKQIRHNLRQVLAQDVDDDIQTVNVVTNFQARHDERRKRAESGQLIYIPTGIKELDDDIFGPMPGQFWVWFGDTNIGKSALAMFIGRTAMLCGFRVWHVCLEDQMNMTLQRYDTCFSKTNYAKFTQHQFTAQETDRLNQIFNLLNTKRNEYLYLSTMPESITMGDVQSEYERIKALYGFYPQVVLLDTPYCMEPTRRRENTRLGTKQIYLEGRGFARRNQIALHFFDQSKQEMQGKRGGTRSASESYDKARIPDGLLTINQNLLQLKEGLVEIFNAKQKDRNKYKSYIIRPRMEIMQFESVIK